MTPELVGGLESPDYASHDKAAHEPYTPVFTADVREELDDLLKRYPNKMAALLPALWVVQNARGWVSEDGMAEVADVLNLTPAYVKGVVTFYTMYHQHPVGRHFIQVCTTSPCQICGADEVRDAFLRHTGCEELGVTSDDGKYTVKNAPTGQVRVTIDTASIGPTAEAMRTQLQQLEVRLKRRGRATVRPSRCRTRAGKNPGRGRPDRRTPSPRPGR